jgi:AcrR family transcriptional regulator
MRVRTGLDPNGEVDVTTNAPRGARARDRVLRAAMDTIVERGLDGVRLAEIARRSKMSEGHVLYYFGTKNRILIETLLWSEERLTRRRREAIAAAGPGWDQLRTFIDLYLPRDFQDPVWGLWVEAWARRHVEDHGVPLRQTSDAWEADLLAILDRGEDTGTFSARPPTFAKRLIALMNGFSVQILERAVERDEVIETVLEQCRIELGSANGRDGGRSSRTARPVAGS